MSVVFEEERGKADTTKEKKAKKAKKEKAEAEDCQ